MPVLEDDIETISRQQPSAVREKFQRLAAEWKSIKTHSSCVEDLVLNDAYLRIVGMGPAALPLILADLEKEPAHWFPALYAITETDPVPERAQGNMQEMTAAWIDWGKEHGYRW